MKFALHFGNNTFSDPEGARRLVRHLISIGHRRIAAIVEPDDVSSARERLQGYREALEAAGAAMPGGAMTLIQGSYCFTCAQQALSPPLPSAA